MPLRYPHSPHFVPTIPPLRAHFTSTTPRPPNIPTVPLLHRCSPLAGSGATGEPHSVAKDVRDQRSDHKPRAEEEVRRVCAKEARVCELTGETGSISGRNGDTFGGKQGGSDYVGIREAPTCPGLGRTQITPHVTSRAVPSPSLDLHSDGQPRGARVESVVNVRLPKKAAWWLKRSAISGPVRHPCVTNMPGLASHGLRCSRDVACRRHRPEEEC